MKTLLIAVFLLGAASGSFAQGGNTTKQRAKPPRTSTYNQQAEEKARKKRQKASDARQAASDTLQKRRLRPDTLRRGGVMKIDTL